MSTQTVRSARRQPRTVRILGYLPECNEHAVQITEGNKMKGYYVGEFAADGGRGFTWQTWAIDGGKCYQVFISNNPSVEPDRCECLGHEQWSHRTVCRHVACTRKLIAEGKI